METELLFNIIGENEEHLFQLSKYDTVGDLKNEIHKKFGVPPNEQNIESWHITPQSDTNTLISCCLESECNFLFLYKTNVTPHRANTDETEISSILSFMQYFSSNFNTRGITFHTCCLEDAFSQAFSTPHRKTLLLYLHNGTDPFSNFFCTQLTRPNIQALLNNHFFLLCWDIEKDDYKSVLIRALGNHDELQSLDRFVRAKISAALVIAPVGSSIHVLSILKGVVSPENFLTTLEQGRKFVINENDEEISASGTQESVFGSKEYQQLMLDMLGDRDYDSFDHFEFEHLKDKILYSFFGPPRQETGYEIEEKNKVEVFFKKIRQQNNLIAKWRDRVIISFIYVCTEPLPAEKRKRAKRNTEYNPGSDFVPIPLFILRKCKNSPNPCRIFIDNIGRVYKSWQSYLEENKLPECEMIFPRNGRYEADENGVVIVERRLSPACSTATTVIQAADIATTVGGITSGGVMIAAASIPAVAAAPLVVPIAGLAGIAAGAYSLGRSAFNLYDRSSHEESLSFFDSPEARGAYINIVAGSLGFVGAGANMAVSRLAAQGFNIGSGATATVNALNIVNLGAGGVGIANASYDVIRSWWSENETPSLLTIVQLSSSILFFGHAVYNYRALNTVIEESQANTLRDYQDSLRSNRHRKAFNKLVKETIRQNNGNVQQGQAEVISTIRNIQNKDEVFATLTRSNRAMNRNNVRFAASNGKITLNGVAVDMTQFGNMERTEVITFLNQLPNRPNPTTADIRSVTAYLENSIQGIGFTEISRLAFGIARIFGETDSTIKEKITNAFSQLLAALRINSTRYIEELDRIFPSRDKYLRLFNMVNIFFQELVNRVEDQYKRWLATRDTQYEEPYFARLSLDVAIRAKEIFNTVTEAYFTVNNKLTQFGVEQLSNYFVTWFASQVYSFEARQERRDRRVRHSRVRASKVKCNVCGGYCYIPIIA